MVQSASLDIDASWFVITEKVKGHGNIGHFGYFSHFGRKISPLCPRKRTKIPWNFKTRAQELTSVVLCRVFVFIRLDLRAFQRSDGRSEVSISKAILTVFTDYHLIFEKLSNPNE